MNKKFIICSFFISINLTSTCQRAHNEIIKSVLIENTLPAEIYLYSCQSDTVEYVLTKKSDAKSLIIYVPGSLPYPSIIKQKDNFHFIWNKDLLNQENTDLLCFGKSKIPVLINESELDSNLLYMDKDGKPFQEYQLNDNLDWYLKNYNQIINYVVKKRKYSKVTIIGGSQGARVALELSLNKKITNLVFMSSDPLGRIATRIDKEYGLFTTRNNLRLESYLRMAKCQNNTLDSTQGYDTYYSWMTFSKPSLLTLSILKIPILIIYGDQDINCPNCYTYELLPNYCPNIKVLKYAGLNHYYEDLDGNSLEKKVFEDVFKWIQLQ